MPTVKIVQKRGIFIKTKLERSDTESVEEFFSQWVDSTDPKKVVRGLLDNYLLDAKLVLNAAGHPTIAGMYIRDEFGKFRLYCELGGGFEMPTPPFHVEKWPGFLIIEDLTLEYFAVNLIQKIDYLREALEKDESKWLIAQRAIIFQNAIEMFKLEKGGVAAAAKQGIDSKAGSKKGSNTRQIYKNYLRQITGAELHKLSPLSQRSNPRLQTTEILAAVQQQCRGNYGTISKGKEKGESKVPKFETVYSIVRELKKA